MEDSNSFQDNNPIYPIDLSIFKKYIENSLLHIISNLGKVEKTLIIDKSCVLTLNYFTSLNQLSNVGIKKKLNLLKKNAFYSESPIYIYIIPPKKECLEMIEFHISYHLKSLQQKKEKLMINNNEKIDNEKQFHIIFIPKINNECQTFIKNSYKYESYYHTHNLGIDIFPFDYDLMSLEQNDCIKDIYINQNYNILTILSKAYIKFETVFGKIKNKFYKGEMSYKLKNLIEKEELNKEFDDNNQLLASFIIDRNVDFITLFCSAITYESLLDEYYEINFNSLKISDTIIHRVNSKIKIDEKINDDKINEEKKDDKINKEKKDEKKDIEKKIKIDISYKNKFFSRIKNYSFPRLSNYLFKQYEEYNILLKKTEKEIDLNKIKIYLDKFSKIKSDKPFIDDNIQIVNDLQLKCLTPNERLYRTYEQSILLLENLNTLQDFYESEMGKKKPYEKILKLICLQSLIQNGIRNKQYEYLKKEFLSIYGYQNIILWNNLEKLNILKKSKFSDSIYAKISKKLNLITEEINDFNPQDTSFAYNGYCSIIIRLIEIGIKKGWSEIKDILNILPGEYFFSKNENEIINPDEKKFILLVFIGGITYGEIAAIRFLNENMQFHKFIILTTSIINTKKFFESISLKMDNFFTFLDFKNSI